MAEPTARIVHNEYIPVLRRRDNSDVIARTAQEKILGYQIVEVHLIGDKFSRQVQPPNQCNHCGEIQWTSKLESICCSLRKKSLWVFPETLIPFVICGKNHQRRPTYLEKSSNINALALASQTMSELRWIFTTCSNTRKRS